MYVFVPLVATEDFPAGFQPGERSGGRGHQEAVAFIDNLLCVVRIDVRVSARHAAFIADSPDGRHRFHDGRMVVLPRVAEVLRQICRRLNMYCRQSRRLLMSYGLCSASNTMPSYDAADSAMALSIVGGEKAVIGIPRSPWRG